MLEQAEVEVPRGDIIRRERSLEEACRYVGYPLVIKHIDGNHGRGITVDIKNYDDALVAFHHAKESSKSGAIIVEKFIVGEDYRLLVVNNQLIAGAIITPAHVIGDG